MRKRSDFGGVLPLVVVCFLIIVVVGIGFFAFSKLFMGGRELQNVVDSGALNVAKHALTTTSFGGYADNLELHGPIEKANFQSQLPLRSNPTNTKVNLLVFNKIVGQLLLVAKNAEEAGTPEALAHARDLYEHVYTGNDQYGGIGKRLTHWLVVGPMFYQSAFIDFVRDLPVNGLAPGTSVALNVEEIPGSGGFLAKGGTSNVYIDPMQASALGVPTISKGNNKAFIPGYQSIRRAGLDIQFVPTRALEPPHLVSGAEFELNKTPPIPDIPPNTFKVTGHITEQKTGKVVKSSGYAIVGAVDEIFETQLSIPKGYIEVRNGDHAPSPNPLGVVSGFENNVMMQQLQTTGVRVSAGNDVFATNAANANIDQWANFNQAYGYQNPIITWNSVPSFPPIGELLTSAGQFQGPILTNHTVEQFPIVGGVPPRLLGYNYKYTWYIHPTLAGIRSPMTCIENRGAGNVYIPADRCRNMISQFQRGFFGGPPTVSRDNSRVSRLLALDAYRYKVLEAAAAAFGRLSEDGLRTHCENISLPEDMVRRTSGLLVYEHINERPLCPGYAGAPPCVPTTGRVGTFGELFDQACTGSDGEEFKQLLYARLRQMKPGVSEAKMLTDLGATGRMPDRDNPRGGANLPMGGKLYIYWDEAANRFQIDANDPPGLREVVAAGGTPATPDGTPRQFWSRGYQAMGTGINVDNSGGGIFINPRGEAGIHDVVWYQHTAGAAIHSFDGVEWIPCSGYNNLLGVMSFKNWLNGANRTNGFVGINSCEFCYLN